MVLKFIKWHIDRGRFWANLCNLQWHYITVNVKLIIDVGDRPCRMCMTEQSKHDFLSHQLLSISISNTFIKLVVQIVLHNLFINISFLLRLHPWFLYHCWPDFGTELKTDSKFKYLPDTMIPKSFNKIHSVKSIVGNLGQTYNNTCECLHCTDL